MKQNQELCLCLMSSNRDSAAYPNTNDFVLELTRRFEYNAIVIGSLELPFAQQLIETSWSSFEFDTGITIPDTSRSITYTANNAPVTFNVVPAQLQGCSSTDGRTWTASNHGLHDQTLAAINPQVVIGENRFRVTRVLDQNRFTTDQLAIPTYATLSSATYCGSQFASPPDLCRHVNLMLRSRNIPYHCEYNIHTQTLCLMNSNSIDTAVGQSLSGQFISFIGGNVGEPNLFPPASSTHSATLPNGNFDSSSLRGLFQLSVNPLNQYGQFFGTLTVRRWNTSEVTSIPFNMIAVSLKYMARAINNALSGIVNFNDITCSFVEDCFVFDTIGSEFALSFGTGGSEDVLQSQIGFDETPTRFAKRLVGRRRDFLDIPMEITVLPSADGIPNSLTKRFPVALRPRVNTRYTTTIPILARTAADIASKVVLCEQKLIPDS
jgi:hypothetical protein